MRSLLVVLSCLSVILWTPVPVHGRTCAKICETTDLWGTGSANVGYKECACTDQTTGAARTGPECGCGVCYFQGSKHIIGQARVNGSCPSGTTACDDCEIASSSGSNDSSTGSTTTTPSSTKASSTDSSSSHLTPSSTSTPGASGDSASATGNADSVTVTSSPTTAPAASNMTASVNSSHGSDGDATDNAGGKLGSPSPNTSSSGSTSTSSGSSSGLATWQIALIICSAVLVIAVVMITITSCYCKARNRIKDNELIEEDTREYEHYWHPAGEDDKRAIGNNLNNSFGGSMTQGGRESSFNSSHSRPNSAKNVSYEPSFTLDERIAAGRTNRGSLGSNGDLPGIYQPFSHRERPSQEVGSRKNLSIEL